MDAIEHRARPARAGPRSSTSARSAPPPSCTGRGRGPRARCPRLIERPAQVARAREEADRREGRGGPQEDAVRRHGRVRLAGPSPCGRCTTTCLPASRARRSTLRSDAIVANPPRIDLMTSTRPRTCPSRITSSTSSRSACSERALTDWGGHRRGRGTTSCTAPSISTSRYVPGRARPKMRRRTSPGSATSQPTRNARRTTRPSTARSVMHRRGGCRVVPWRTVRTPGRLAAGPGSSPSAPAR